MSISTATSSDGVNTRIARRVADSLGPQRYRMWFERSARFDYDDQQNRLQVAVPNRFVADWIGRNFHADICRAASDEVGDTVQLDLSVEPARFQHAETRPDADAATVANVATGAAVAAPVGQTTRRRTNDPTQITARTGRDRAQTFRHQLAEFVVGPSNELAYAAACRFAEEDSHVHGGQTLFLHGGCGLGKTHLLQGVCRRLLELHPTARVLYTTGEQFTNDFLAAVRSNRIDSFRARIRKLDLLAVDDVHFFANKVATQQEFLHSFDAIELGGAKVLLASDSHPKLIKQFSEALVSRCVRGMVCQIAPPDLATRIRIIERMAQRRGLSLIEAVTHVLATRCRGSVREIEGTLTKLHALAHLMQQRQGPEQGPVIVGHALLHRLFESQQHEVSPRIVKFDTILKCVCEQLAVPSQQVLGSGRPRQVVLARSLVIHLARQLTSMSYPEIAAAMGRPTHSTIITAAQRIQQQIDQADQSLVLPGTMESLTLRDLVDRLKDAISRGG